MEILLLIPDSDSSRIAVELDDESVVVLPCSKFYYEKIKKGTSNPYEATFLSGASDDCIVATIEAAYARLSISNRHFDFNAAMDLILIKYETDGAVDDQDLYAETLSQSQS